MLKSILLILVVFVTANSQTIQDVLRVETNARQLLNQYAFKRDVTIQTIGSAGEVTGEYVRKSEFVFTDSGDRVEKILYKHSSLTELKITDEDLMDLSGPHLLGLDNPDKYDLEMNNSVIEVRPKVVPDPRKMKERYFVGQLWINPISLQIIRVRGRVEPQGKQRFWWFDTTRESVGAAYLFPTRTVVEDTLHFDHKDIRVKATVRYYDYRKFRSTLTLTELDASEFVSSTPISAHWPIDARVKVYFTDQFTVKQKIALLRSLDTWNALVPEVQFEYSGVTDGQRFCFMCLTIGRKEVVKGSGNRHYAQFQGFHTEGFVRHGWINIDFKTTNPEALEGFVLHELGHGLGLMDSADGLMGPFSHVNRPRKISPNQQDVETIRKALRP